MTTPKVVIAVSVDGEYPSASIAIGTADQISAQALAFGSFAVRVFSDDVVRARNRLAQSIIDTTDAEYVLWWDTDTYVTNLKGTIGKMLASGHDVIGAAYPRKRKARAIVGVPKGGKSPVDGIVEMNAIGFGFTLTSRQALERVGTSARTYIDVLSTGEHVRTADRFGLAYRHIAGDGEICECAWGADVYGSEDPCENVELVSEDYSFCLRWRDTWSAPPAQGGTAGRVYMLVPDLPVQHFGTFAYE